VQFRVPHHVIPTAWLGNFWTVELLLATGLFIFIYFANKSKTIRFVAAFALGSISLGLFGLVLYVTGEVQLLRFYWFRFPDVMVPFLSITLIAVILNEIADGNPIKNSAFPGFLHGMQIIIKDVMLVVAITSIVLIVFQSYRLQTEFNSSQQDDKEPRHLALEWISENTPSQAIFLVDPTISDFYFQAQRAMFVSWKHSPQSAVEILEWYKRIKLCNGNRDPEKSGFDSLKEISTNFYYLDEEQIQQIADLYGISYYLGLPNQPITFERVYSNSYFTLYRVDQKGN